VGLRFEHFNKAGGNGDEIPNTDIYLIVTTDKTTEYKLNTYLGKAFEIKKADFKSNKVPLNALIACGSWYAGGGDYLYVTDASKGSISVMWRYLDEGQSADNPQYISIKQIKILEVSKVVVVPLVDVNKK